MQNFTTSSALLVQYRLLQLMAEDDLEDLEIIQREVEQYFANYNAGFVYDRNHVVAATWIITHNLGKYPQVTLLDDDGNEFEADVFFNNLNQVTVVFAEPASGKAVLL